MIYSFGFLLAVLSVAAVYFSPGHAGARTLTITRILQKNRKVSYVASALCFMASTRLLMLAEGLLAGLFGSIVLWIVLAGMMLLLVPLAFRKS